MGIPPEVVMKATGHRDYKTIKPYIATSDETQMRDEQVKPAAIPFADLDSSGSS